MKNLKAKLIGVLITLAVISAVLCVVASLLMLGWNVAAVSMLSVAVAITFWKALAIVAILWLCGILYTVIRIYGTATIQKWQMDYTLNKMRHFAEQMDREGKPHNEPDLGKHFGFN